MSAERRRNLFEHWYSQYGTHAKMGLYFQALRDPYYVLDKRAANPLRSGVVQTVDRSLFPPRGSSLYDLTECQKLKALFDATSQNVVADDGSMRAGIGCYALWLRLADPEQWKDEPFWEGDCASDGSPTGRTRMATLLANGFDYLKAWENRKRTYKMDKFLAAIRTKPFILLAGISGTGKSRMVRQLARGCCPRFKSGSTSEDHPLYNPQKPGNFEMIQVRPNWHDSTQLMGYESRVSGKAEFVVKPFVKFLAKAWLYEEEGIPFFLCLDEMNLAPVEQYFAEYLSVIETRQTKDGKIVTDPLVTFPNEELLREAFKEIYQDVDHDKAERFIQKFIDKGGIPIPRNFIVMGTVNMDETTFSFSRKVLDRAMSFELNEVDMDGGLEADPDCEHGSIDLEAAKCEFTQGHEVYAAAKDDCDKIKSFLVGINRLLDKTPFKIAYRTRNEIMIYCHERTKYGVSLAKALDEATSMKILSRIEGDKRRLVVHDEELSEYNRKGLLESLLDVILKGLKAVRGGDGEYTESGVCAGKLKEMIVQLESGYTSFWTR